MTGVLRGKTIEEKLYGPGFRPTPHREVKAPWAGCGIEGCSNKPHGSVELYVDDPPPIMDWYTRMLAKLPAQAWATVKFCEAHLKDVIQRSVYDFQDEPDLWAPWRASPPVLVHPPKVFETPKLIVGG
jgi:hypothetical protein